MKYMPLRSTPPSSVEPSQEALGTKPQKASEDKNFSAQPKPQKQKTGHGKKPEKDGQERDFTNYT